MASYQIANTCDKYEDLCTIFNVKVKQSYIVTGIVEELAMIFLQAAKGILVGLSTLERSGHTAFDLGPIKNPTPSVCYENKLIFSFSCDKTAGDRGNISVACQVTAGVPNKTDFKWERHPFWVIIKNNVSSHGKAAGERRCTRTRQYICGLSVPPVVKPLANVVALERGNISVACQITAGVPNNTDFKWERIFDMIQVSMEQTLGIINIGRTQSGYYRCTASNLMEPTGYDATFGNNEAEVTNFTLSNSNHGQNFEVNENTKVIFYCQAKSNPLPNISLLKQSQYLKSATNTNDLEFTISESVCEDDGTYQCTAQNTHNTQADVRSLTLSATGVPAVLTLKLVAFPRPSVKDFLWEKKDLATNTWHIVADDTYIDIIISEDGLQTELFFRSVEEKDFGSYIVHVNNELGTYSETFRLLAQGFDGGLPQTFHVEYRDVETSVWRNDMVNTGKISHVIVGLSPNTIYEIRVYSTNDIGRSNVSNAIEVTTLKRPET
ncbi:HMCN2-like protein, partial [Mya arenaria]